MSKPTDAENNADVPKLADFHAQIVSHRSKVLSMLGDLTPHKRERVLGLLSKFVVMSTDELDAVDNALRFLGDLSRADAVIAVNVAVVRDAMTNLMREAHHELPK